MSSFLRARPPTCPEHSIHNIASSFLFNDSLQIIPYNNRLDELTRGMSVDDDITGGRRGSRGAGEPKANRRTLYQKGASHASLNYTGVERETRTGRWVVCHGVWWFQWFTVIRLLTAVMAVRTVCSHAARSSLIHSASYMDLALHF